MTSNHVLPPVGTWWWREVNAPPQSRNGQNKHDTSTNRIVTDGGQTQAEPEDSESESGSDDESDEESANAASEPDSSEPSAEDGGDTDESEDEEADAQEDEDDYHVEDAEDVYEGDETANVLHLDLDGLFLDVLGLEVNLNPVTLDVSARPGGNNLLGNLLSTVTGLFDGASGVVDGIRSLLGKPVAFLRGLLAKPKQLLQSATGGETSDGEETADDGEEGDEDEAGSIASIIGWIRSRLSNAVEWIKERIVGIIPGLPVEELVSSIVSELLRQIIDELERSGRQDGGADKAGEEAESQSESPPQAEATS